jgi:hypothetical protein
MRGEMDALFMHCLPQQKKLGCAESEKLGCAVTPAQAGIQFFRK